MRKRALATLYAVQPRSVRYRRSPEAWSLGYGVRLFQAGTGDALALSPMLTDASAQYEVNRARDGRSSCFRGTDIVIRPAARSIDPTMLPRAGW